MKDKPIYDCNLTELEVYTLLNYLESQAHFYLDCKRTNIELSKKVPVPQVLKENTTKEDWEERAEFFSNESKKYRSRVNYFKKILNI